MRPSGRTAAVLAWVLGLYIPYHLYGGVGEMFHRIAQERPELFAGMGVVISLMPADNKCQQRDAPIPIMYQVGTADSGVKYEGGSSGNSGTNLSARESIAYWVEHNQCETAPVSSMVEDGPYDDRSTITLELYDCPTTRTKVGIYHMHGAGHVPPSIDVQVSEAWESLAGVQNHDLESARAFWSFLKEFEH